MTKVIAVSNNKGGVGKTSLVANLSAMLAEDYSKILLIDLDGQGQLSLSFGKSSKSPEFEYNIHDVLTKNINPAQAIYQLHGNIDIIPASSNMDNFDMEILLNQEKYFSFFKILDNVLLQIKSKYAYDYILIDCPPSLSLATLNALSASDYVLIPSQLDAYAVESLDGILNAVFNMQLTQNQNLKILGVVPSLVNLKTVLERDILSNLKDYLESLDITLYDSSVPKSTGSPSSIAYYSLPITLNNKYKRNPVSIAYRNLYKELPAELF